MTDPGFKVEGIHQAVPFRPRIAFDGYQLFEKGDSAILVEPATAEGLRAAAAKTLPNETGGLVSGRTLRDAAGTYVLVSGFVEADPGSGRAAAVDVSPEATARLREKSARASPTADVVGWWHSHSRPSQYSDIDLASQSVWSQPQSVGLLVFADGEPWATAYMGPEARRLGYPSPARPLTPPSVSHTAGPEGNGRGPGGRQSAGRPRVMPNQPADSPTRYGGPADWRPSPRVRGLFRLAVIIVAALVVISPLVILHGMADRLNAGQQALAAQLSSQQRRLSGQIASGLSRLDDRLRPRVPATGSPVTIGSSCLQGTPAATGTGYTCTAVTSGARGRVSWKLDGHPSGTGRHVTIRVLPDGHAHHVLALLQTATGTYQGAPLIVSPEGRP